MVDTGTSDRIAPAEWTTLPDDRLLEVRMCDLALSIAGTFVEPLIAQVNEELDRRGLVRPHYWLSDEWFTPDGVPGVAVPFYLAHPRLEKLEKSQMLEVEGGEATSCLRILLDARSRAQVEHQLDMRTELRFGERDQELARQLDVDPNSMLVLGLDTLVEAETARLAGLLEGPRLRPVLLVRSPAGSD